MDRELNIEIIKSSGKKARFSLDKLSNSLRRSGADHNLVEQIVNQVMDELYDGISTKEIYNRAYALLKKNKSVFASKYKLKRPCMNWALLDFPLSALLRPF